MTCLNTSFDIYSDLESVTSIFIFVSGLSQSRECSRTATRSPTLTVCKQPMRGLWGFVQTVKNGVFGRTGGSARMSGRRARRPDGRAVPEKLGEVSRVARGPRAKPRPARRHSAGSPAVGGGTGP